jgi:hypothetical protein
MRIKFFERFFEARGILENFTINFSRFPLILAATLRRAGH